MLEAGAALLLVVAVAVSSGSFADIRISRDLLTKNRAHYLTTPAFLPRC